MHTDTLIVQIEVHSSVWTVESELMCKVVIVAMLHQEWKSMAAAHGRCCSNEQWNNCVCVCVCERRTEFPFKSPVKIVSM